MKIPRLQGRDLASLLIALVTLLAVAGYIVLQTHINSRTIAQFETLRSDYQGLYEEAVQAGAEPSAPPPEDVPSPAPLTPLPEPTPGPSGATGATGERGPGPSREQVRAVVEEMFATGAYDGEDGRPPTDAEIDAAVERYCAEDTCDGEPGQNGANGADGADGEDGADGAPGPPPTAEQIRAGVEAYCAAQPGGTCEGADGRDGTNGTDGEDGADGKDGKFVPGDYTCPDETPYMRGFSVQENGDWAVTCEAFPPGITTPES